MIVGDGERMEALEFVVFMICWLAVVLGTFDMPWESVTISM